APASHEVSGRHIQYVSAVRPDAYSATAVTELASPSGSLSSRYSRARQLAPSVSPERIQPSTPGRGRNVDGAGTSSPVMALENDRSRDPNHRAARPPRTSRGSPTTVATRLAATDSSLTSQENAATPSGSSSTACRNSRAVRCTDLRSERRRSVAGGTRTGARC